MNDVKISVIMPAFRAMHLLPRVLPPLLAMRDRGEVVEVIVVDDASPDGTADMARDMGAEVYVMDQNGGPGAARNFAATKASGEVLWFVDSDVIAKDDGARWLQDIFGAGDVAAAFGSYDDSPEGPWFSRYKNLMHRFYHQSARRQARTWWAGCGAIRADMFSRVGGFDVDTYRIPSIEDIELGYRIHAAGGDIVVDPRLQGKHLKIWSVRNSVHTDIFCRALPWSRLIINREGLSDDLNTGWMERFRAGLAGLLLLTLLAMIVQPSLWPLPLILLALIFAVNAALFRFMWDAGGPIFAIKALLYHQFYYLYSACAFVWCLFEFHILGRRNRLHVP
ncbi:glycosyltransferase [Ruegeria sp.]|uniref:glycosyltransferase family 2 protein n=1 Tax=Ruegeria sp. TaxID=1879320 RepID=UPI00230890A7|nr:glycosyltransferase [Ruegeria sp.]MDA7964155.1 glycosyltransferase [Ruegeria sp.]